MKILFIAGLDSAHSHRWISSFCREEHEIGWINLRKTDKEATFDCKIKPRTSFFSSEILNILVTFFYYLFQVLIWRPDVIHVHYMGLNGVLGLILPCKKKIFTAWGSDIIFPKYPKILNMMIKRADMLTTDAQHVLERLVFFGASEEKVKIINFGIETHFFTKKPFEMKFRQKIFKGINEDDPIIISLRNHEKVYDIQTLIESIPKVLEKIPNARFAIGGSGSLTQQHVCLADKLSVSKNINFFGSYLHDELPNLFGQTSLYVSTSLSDAGLSASTAEAMACEVPVIISDSGENGVWITEGVNGNMFEVKDSSRLAELIIENLFNVDIACEKGMKGREVIVRNNDVSNEMNKMNNFYFSL